MQNEIAQELEENMNEFLYDLSRKDFFIWLKISTEIGKFDNQKNVFKF